MLSLPASCGAAGWDKKDVIFKNKAEKLLKTKGKTTLRAGNKPESKAEKLLKTRTCGKNKPETNRKAKRAILVKIKNDEKTNRKTHWSEPEQILANLVALPGIAPFLWITPACGADIDFGYLRSAKLSRVRM